MRQAVADNFLAFTIPLEGKVNFMYLDQHRAADGTLQPLVTTGIGNLIDPVPLALRLPWLVNGRKATTAEILNSWCAVKKRVDMSLGGGKAYGGLPDNVVRLDDAGLNGLVFGKLKSNEVDLRKRFPHYDEWPAPAQMAIHSMSWALGTFFHFPRFEAAVNSSPPDWREAALQCHMSNGAPARNAANRVLFLMAAAGGDPDVLPAPPYVPLRLG